MGKDVMKVRERKGIVGKSVARAESYRTLWVKLKEATFASLKKILTC